MSKVRAWIMSHRKAIIGYIVAAAVAAFGVYYHTAGTRMPSWVPFVIAIAGALGVHFVPNTAPPAPPAKETPPAGR